MLYARFVDDTTIGQVIAGASAAGRQALSEIESKRILDAIGIATAMAEPARSADEAAAAAVRAGFPAVLKVISPDVTHKSEVGGVVLGLRSEQEVRDAFERIRRSLAERAPQARFEGVAVQAMAEAGVELIAGIVRDERFGPLIVAGLGGIFVEVFKDTSMRLAPIDAREARAMLEELRGVSILHGARGAKPIDFAAAADLLVKLSEFAAGRREIQEMDLNPIVAYERGVKVLDARVLLANPDGGSQAADPNKARRLENLRKAFNARTVAVIGDKRMGGYMWLRAMKRFSGKLYSVQIDPNEIPGIEAMGVVNYKSLAEVPEPIDYAVSAVPRQVAPRILKDCVANKVGGIGFFTSGFSETTEELGITLERQLKETATAAEIALVGPNCMGLYNAATGMCNFPDLNTGVQGDVCFISQSGTHTINFSSQAPIRGIRVNKAASIGNVLMIEAADYLDLLVDDPATRLVGMYVEGVRDGRRFFESLKRAAARVPVLVWKGGMTEAGARATFSHTGSMATPAAVWNSMVRQSGAVSVFGLDAMLDAVEMMARGRAMNGRRMGLVAMTGGQSVVITDTFAGAGLEVPTLSESSYEELKSFFNIIGGSYRNPLDAGGTIGGGVNTGNLQRILDILDRDPLIDAIVLEIGTGMRAHRWGTHEDELTSLLDRIAEFNNKTAKPFVVILHPANVETIVVRAKQLARERGLVVFDSFERSAAALRVSYDYWSARAAREGA
ncbi:MAG TPA: acetate--CoA ligase family protein [Candidatus Binataceae bacterium]|nr:acetate--CoA ligase family protein [Candidatus Binataceae bacterium]